MLAAISEAKVETTDKCQATLTRAFQPGSAHKELCTKHASGGGGGSGGEGGGEGEGEGGGDASTGLPCFWPNHGAKLQQQQQQQRGTRENATAPSQQQHWCNVQFNVQFTLG